MIRLLGVCEMFMNCLFHLDFEQRFLF
jgi:hypothetical protein